MIIRSRAPLRIGFSGGGTDISPYSDIYGGYVLSAAINMYSYCIIDTNNTEIEIHSQDQQLFFKTEPKSFLEISGSCLLHKGVYNRIIKEYNGGEPLTFKMVTYSDAIVGSGLGTSSTLVVSIIKAFVEWLNLPLGEYDIADLAYRIEREDIGYTGGKQDQYNATFGGVNFMEFYRNRVIINPLQIKRWILNELESYISLCFVGISRNSSKIIDKQIKKIKNKNVDSLNLMHELKENALKMKEILLMGDIKKFGKYLDLSWNIKKRITSSISNEKIDYVYQVALDAGSCGGKVSGAGGGGFMILMTNPTRKREVETILKKIPGVQIFRCNFELSGVLGWTIY